MRRLVRAYRQDRLYQPYLNRRTAAFCSLSAVTGWAWPWNFIYWCPPDWLPARNTWITLHRRFIHGSPPIGFDINWRGLTGTVAPRQSWYRTRTNRTRSGARKTRFNYSTYRVAIVVESIGVRTAFVFCEHGRCWRIETDPRRDLYPVACDCPESDAPDSSGAVIDEGLLAERSVTNGSGREILPGPRHTL